MSASRVLTSTCVASFLLARHDRCRAPSQLRRPQLVASDLDGTLLPPTLEFTAATKSGVAALQAAAIPFLIVTGRMFRSARRMADLLGLRAGRSSVTGVRWWPIWAAASGYFIRPCPRIWRPR